MRYPIRVAHHLTNVIHRLREGRVEMYATDTFQGWQEILPPDRPDDEDES